MSKNYNCIIKGTKNLIIDFLKLKLHYFIKKQTFFLVTCRASRILKTSNSSSSVNKLSCEDKSITTIYKIFRSSNQTSSNFSFFNLDKYKFMYFFTLPLCSFIPCHVVLFHCRKLSEVTMQL